MELKKFLEEYKPQLENNFLSNEERLRLIKIYDSLEDKPLTFDDWLLEHTPEAVVDYVIPFMDSSDKKWREDFYKYAIEEKLESEAICNFKKNLLKNIFKGIESYAPWIGLIHLLVSSPSQVPEWIDRSKIHIAYHKDFIPSALLPTFNFSVIECFLHEIPGLAERFIYARPHILFIGSVRLEDFFKENKPVRELNVAKSGMYVSYDMYYPQLKIAEDLANLKINENYTSLSYFPYLKNTPKSFFKSFYKKVYETNKNFILYNNGKFEKEKDVGQPFYTYMGFLENHFYITVRGLIQIENLGDNKILKEVLDYNSKLNYYQTLSFEFLLKALKKLQKMPRGIFVDQLSNSVDSYFLKTKDSPPLQTSSSKVAIIVPIYNCEKWIKECLDSIKCQIYQNWNCFLIDDGSTDNTKDVIKPYLKDSRFHYYYKENGGAASARNFGLDLVTDEDYIYIPDADDFISEHLLADAVNILDKFSKIDVFAFGYKQCGPNNIYLIDDSICKEPVEAFEGYLIQSTHWFHEVGIWTQVFRKKVFEENHLRIDPSFKNFEDYLFSGTLLKDKRVIVYSPHDYYVWRQQNLNSLTSKFYRKGNLKDMLRFVEIVKEWKNIPGIIHPKELESFIIAKEAEQKMVENCQQYQWLPAQISIEQGYN